PLAVTLRDPALERLAVGRPLNEQRAFERAAAEELLLAREDALGEMRRRGILVLDVLPAAAAEAVVERYHRLKRRGVPSPRWELTDRAPRSRNAMLNASTASGSS